MPSQITNYQCPACTGPLRYDGGSGKLVCDYCGSSFTVQEIEALYQDKLDQAEAAGVAQAAKEEAQAAAAAEAAQIGAQDPEWDLAQAGMKAYSCPSCGLLRQPHRGARPVSRHAQAGLYPALQAG